jgi:hypothetical protein
MMVNIIRKHPLYFGMLCAILGMTMTWSFLRVLHPNPVSFLVAVALDSHICQGNKNETGYIAVDIQGSELRCFYKQDGVYGKISSGHLRLL